MEKVRVDKWMWAVRLYKTRGIAADACDKERVKINDQSVKASRNLKAGEILVLHRGPWHQSIKVLALAEKRMSAALAKDFYEDVTPEDQIERLRLHRAAIASWNIKDGAGRPTKKDRRDIDEFMGDF
jgi:ribosome-associated heat shock protein Hsp15